MIRHWLKLILLMLLVLIQTACPKYWTPPTNDNVSVPTSDDQGGSG
jgi:hypothetical protein